MVSVETFFRIYTVFNTGRCRFSLRTVLIMGLESLVLLRLFSLSDLTPHKPCHYRLRSKMLQATYSVKYGPENESLKPILTWRFLSLKLEKMAIHRF